MPVIGCSKDNIRGDHPHVVQLLRKAGAKVSTSVANWWSLWPLTLQVDAMRALQLEPTGRNTFP